jgi:hypothetical protein
MSFILDECVEACILEQAGHRLTVRQQKHSDVVKLLIDLGYAYLVGYRLVFPEDYDDTDDDAGNEHE